MNKVYVLIFLGCLFAQVLSAQKIKGHVYEAQTNEALAGVNIFYKQKGVPVGTTSDEQGAYEPEVESNLMDDVSGALNLLTDEGYRESDYNKRLRVGGNITY